jgi:hypothetical protein
VRFIGEGASGINAGATRGLDANVMGDSDLLRTISTLDLKKLPLIHDHEVLNSEENKPARVWREGRAKATGVCGS